MASPPGTNYFPTKEFNYDAFIEEIRALTKDALALKDNDLSADAFKFKAWRRRVEDSFRKVGEIGYQRPNCDVSRRLFTDRYGSKREAGEAFVRDMTDTLDELQIIVENFDKHGPGPKKSGPLIIGKAPEAVPTPVLPVPPEVTWPWLKQSVPMKLVLQSIAIVVAILGVVIPTTFSAGRWFERFERRSLVAAPSVPAPVEVAPRVTSPLPGRAASK